MKCAVRRTEFGTARRQCGAIPEARHTFGAARRSSRPRWLRGVRITAVLHDSLAAQCQSSRFPAKRDIRHAGHLRKSAQTAGFCCRKAHLGYLSDNYTSEKGCLSIPQTQNIPVRGFRGAFFVPEARAERERHTRQRSAYRNKRKRAAADMPHRGVEKVYAPNAPGCAKIRFPYHKHRTRRIGGTKFHPRKCGYNICEQPRFSR